jgi:hypothetical protein
VFEKLLYPVLALLVPTMSVAQSVSASVTAVAPVGAALTPSGQLVIDITTLTRHPSHLEAQSLRTPNGVRIVSSTLAPENKRTCSRAAHSLSECRQTFRVTLGTGARCHAGGNYEALFGSACWPGTAASLCQHAVYRYEFKLGAESTCHPAAKVRSK